jgi:hypothetical protein
MKYVYALQKTKMTILARGKEGRISTVNVQNS